MPSRVEVECFQHMATSLRSHNTRYKCCVIDYTILSASDSFPKHKFNLYKFKTVVVTCGKNPLSPSYSPKLLHVFFL